MIYATLDDLHERAGEDEIRQIADHDGDGTADPDVIDAALADATNMVNGYVSAKYPLPLHPAPDLLRTYTVSIARYKLHRHGAPDHVEKHHDDAIKALYQISKGTIALPVADGSIETPNAGVHRSYSPPQVFSDEKLRGWSDD